METSLFLNLYLNNKCRMSPINPAALFSDGSTEEELHIRPHVQRSLKRNTEDSLTCPA